MIESIVPASLGNEGTSTSKVSQSAEQKSQFLQLLVAQMKSQDPLNPMEGTQFVTQLAQFTSLEELINIREVMEGVYETLGRPAGQSESANTSESDISEANEN